MIGRARIPAVAALALAAACAPRQDTEAAWRAALADACRPAEAETALTLYTLAGISVQGDLSREQARALDRRIAALERQVAGFPRRCRDRIRALAAADLP